MAIEVKGHSGCAIDVVREGTDLFVYKSSRDASYLDRLCNQAVKQREAAAQAFKHIRVPAILDLRRTASEVSVKMEYVYSKNFIEFFEQADASQILSLSTALIDFVESEIAMSHVTVVPADVMTSKMESVAGRVAANAAINGDAEVAEIIARSRDLFAACGDMALPVGRCHGDLTFSNILFSGTNYYFIDFLDSFIEAPLMDIVKLRQDTAHGWSQLMYTKRFDSVRQRIVNDKIDEALDAHFRKKYAWYARYYAPMQLMNFLRILQYAHDPHVISYLKTTISTLLTSGDANCAN